MYIAGQYIHMKKLVYILLGSLVLSGCYYDNEEDLYSAAPNPNDTAAISYVTTIQPMIAQNCAIPGCHVANAQLPDLSSYAGLFANKDRVKARGVNGSPSAMPASGLMSPENRNKLGTWIDRGARNN